MPVKNVIGKYNLPAFFGIKRFQVAVLIVWKLKNPEKAFFNFFTFAVGTVCDLRNNVTCFYHSLYFTVVISFFPGGSVFLDSYAVYSSARCHTGSFSVKVIILISDSVPSIEQFTLLIDIICFARFS